MNTIAIDYYNAIKAVLCAVGITLITALSIASISHYLPASKIEEGTTVVKNDTITTVVIPDIR